MSDWKGFAVAASEPQAAENGLQQRRANAEHHRARIQAQVREWIAQQGLQDWLQGCPDLVIPDETVQALRQRIDQTFTGAERRWATNFLSAGLERGRLERGWSVRVPPRILVLRGPTPPLNALTFPALTQEGLIDQALQAHWQRSAQTGAEITFEQILISAIWSSALIGEDRIRQVAAALRANTLRVSPDGRWVWTEWTDRSGNWQRHLFDPFTAQLALRWFDQRRDSPPLSGEADSSPSVARPIWKALKRFLDVQSLGLDSYTDFVRCAQAKWHYRLPPFLAQAARGLVANACLPPHAWWRLLMGQRLAPEPIPAPTVERTGPGRASATPSSPDAIVPSTELRRLLRAAPQQALHIVRVLRHFVRQHATDRDRLEVVLAGWLTGLLRPSGRKGIRLSSARELLARVDRKLAAVLGTHLPDEVTVWDDAIQSIVQATGERHRSNTATALQQLDTYVRAHKRWDSPAPDLDEGVGSSVDAQLMTELEFEEVLATLRRSAQPRHSQAAAILGYRCGLRRTEIRGLRWIDVQLYPQPLLFVRSHAGRALKRDSGRRVLPLSAFCTQEELELLRQIHAETERLLQNRPDFRQTALFLPDPQAPDQPRPEEALFNPVQEAMRAVCGEPSQRFHHLRHSAANALLAQFMDDLTPGAAALLGVKPESIAPKRQALLGLGEAQRPLLWAVAAFMGHATPQTTLGSYVHLLDLLLGQAVQHEASSPPSKVIAWLAGSTVNWVDVQQHRLGPSSSWVVRSAHWVKKLATSSAHAQSLCCPWPAEPPSGGAPSAGQPSPVDSALMNITDALALLAALRRVPYDTESVRPVSDTVAQRIHQVMERWAQLRGTSPARHTRTERPVAPMVVGHLRLERPRTLKQLRSRALRTTAQSALEAWRKWSQADAAAAEQALSLHWRLHDSDDHAVAFTALEDARQWKQMLDTLSMHSPALQAHALSWQLQPALRSAHTATEQVHHWATALGGAVTISVQAARSFHPSHPSPPDGQLRVIDAAHGKARPGGLIAALDAAAYVMTISILVRKGP